MSLPSTRIRPSSISSRPPSARSAVVLPQPDGPSRATSSPGSMSMVRPSRAWTLPYQRCRSWNWTRTPARWSVAVAMDCSGHDAGSSSAARSVARPARDTGDDDQQDEREDQRRERDGDRDECVALAEREDHDLEGVERQQRRDRELAQDERDREHGRRQDPRADVRQDDLEDRARPARAEASGRLGERRDVDAAQARVDRPVREREDQDDVDEGEGERRSADAPEVLAHPSVDRADADDDHDGRDGQRQQAQELHHAAHPRDADHGPDHRRDEQQEHPEDRERGDLERQDDAVDQVGVGQDVGECPQAPAAVVTARRELQHREQGQDEVADDHDEDGDPRRRVEPASPALAPAALGRHDERPVGSGRAQGVGVKVIA